ncbi:MAG: hypothetical protein ABI837_00535 [Acidobacteriota bacterium]
MGFAYHGNAMAFGARIERPTTDVIPSQASVVLAPCGGEGTATVKNFNYKGIITFDEANSYVAGSSETLRGDDGQETRVYNTLATVSVRNLNIANMFFAESIVARVSSRHDGLQDVEGKITFDGSMMEGVRIAGYKGDVTLDTSLFARYPTYDSFVSGLQEKNQDVTDRAPMFGWQAGKNARGPQKGSGGLVSATLLDSLTHRIPDVSEFKPDRRPHIYRDGFGIRVQEFGTIYLAEVHMKPGQRRLSMLRFDLGCPLCGDAAGPIVEGNGAPTIP